MITRDVMTPHAEYLTKNATVKEAALRMVREKAGFLPVSDEQQQKLVGAVTDRDLVVRAIARGKDPETTKLSEVLSEPVLYCYEEDHVDDVARNMMENDCYRLVVLENPDTKRLTGVVSLNDIAHSDKARTAGNAAAGIRPVVG
ncbi:MAG: CBS domain-containing protein [Pseudomonadales bacterium]|jgi:CBS domain-containing protein|nr:CBS domain-containing protein [Pseudomonadales bacterium]